MASQDMRARALSAAELTDAASSLVTTYTDKLNSVDTIGVLHQSGYMMLAATSGLFLYVTFLRPRFGRQIAPKAKNLFLKLSHLRGRAVHLDEEGKKTRGMLFASHKHDSDEVHGSGEKRDYFGRMKRGIAEFWDILRVDEDFHLMDCGLDSVAYLRLIWMAFTIFALVSLATLPSLVPLDWKQHHPKETWSIETIKKAELNDFTIQGLKGRPLLYHIIAMYGVSLIVYAVMWWNCRAISNLRVKYLTNPSYLRHASDIHKRSAIIADLGPKMDDSRVQALYEKKLATSLDLCLPNETRKQRETRLQLEAWKEVMAYRIYQKACKVLEQIDPSIVHPAELQENMKKVNVCVFDTPDPVGRDLRMKRRNELVEQMQYAISEHLKDETKKEETLMIREPGLTAMFTTKVEAVNYYRGEIVRSWTKINKQEHYYALIGFPCAGYLSHFVQASQSLWASWEVGYAPTPNGIIWQNVRATSHLRATRYLLGYGVLMVLLVVYSGPITVIALLSNVGAITAYFPILDAWSRDHRTVFIALTTTVPPALSAMLFAMLPKIIHFIAHKQGAKTHRSLQSRIIHWYLAFVILAQLVIFPSLSTIFSLLTSKQLKEKTKDASGLLKIWARIIFFLTNVPSTYQTQANYWLNWLAMRWFLAVFQLLQGPILARKSLEHIYRKMTAQGTALSTAEPAEYEIHIPQAMFLMALRVDPLLPPPSTSADYTDRGLIYAPMVPLVSVFATVALLILYAVHKLQALLLYHTESETLARFWLPEMDRLLVFLCLAQALMGLTTGLQESAKMGVLVLPAILVTVIYRFWLRAKYQYTLVDMLHPWAMHQTAIKHIDKEDLKRTYGFEPKGVKVEFDEEINEAAQELMKKSGLGRLLDIADEKIDEADLTIAKEKTKGLMRIAKTGLARMAAGGTVNHNTVLRQRAQRLQAGGQSAPPNGPAPAQQPNASTTALPPNMPGQQAAANPVNLATAQPANPYGYMNPYAMAGAFAARFYAQQNHNAYAQAVSGYPPAHSGAPAQAGNVQGSSMAPAAPANIGVPASQPMPGQPQNTYPAAPAAANQASRPPIYSMPQQLPAYRPGAMMANPMIQAGVNLYRRSFGKPTQ